MNTLRVGFIGTGRISDLHAEVAIAALRAGKHVSVQKPMATTLADAD